MELNELISKTANVVNVAAKVKEVVLSSESIGNDNSLKETDNSANTGVTEKVNQLIESLVSSQSDSKLAKIVSASMKIANATGALELTKNTAFDIASMSDETVTRIKTAYQVANGEIDMEEAADKLIDRAAIRLTTLSEAFIDKKLPLVVDVMCNALVSAFPQTAPLAPIIKNTVAIFQPKLKTFVKKGISAVAVYAKKVAPKVIGWAKSKVSSFAKSLTLKFA